MEHEPSVDYGDEDFGINVDEGGYGLVPEAPSCCLAHHALITLCTRVLMDAGQPQDLQPPAGGMDGPRVCLDAMHMLADVCAAFHRAGQRQASEGGDGTLLSGLDEEGHGGDADMGEAGEAVG